MKSDSQVVVGLMGVKGSGKDTCAKYLVQEHNFIRIGFADKLYQEVADAFLVSVEFLGDRRGKEVPLPHLAVEHCLNDEFKAVVYVEDVKANPMQNGASVAEVAKLLGCSRQQVYNLVNSKKLTPLPGLSVLRFNLLEIAAQAKLTGSRVTSAESYRKAMTKYRSPREVLQWWGTEYRRRVYKDSFWLDIVADEIAANPGRSYVITDVRFSNEAKFVEGMPNGTLCRIRRSLLEQAEAVQRAKKGTAAHPSETELLNWPVALEIENEEGNPGSLKVGVSTLMDMLRKK